jgi:hypothetical protein
MTDLQIGLLALGVAAVAGVVVYNRVQERAVRREAERSFGSSHSDVLLDGGAERREPVLGGAAAAAPVRGPAQASGLPDGRVDYIMLLRIAVGIPAAAALESWRAIQQRFGGRVLLVGSDGAGWRPVGQGDFGSFTSLRAALQIVSRSGVVGDAELIEFRSEVETMASRIRAEVAAPEMKPALEAAHALDKLCAECDVQVAFHVVGPDLEAGLVDAAAGELGDGPFEVSRRTDGLTLVLDVPRTTDVVRAYEAMTRAAKQAAAKLGAGVVDDRGQPLDERALAAIEAQLEPMRRQLADHGIEPGSPLAQRLFS